MARFAEKTDRERDKEILTMWVCGEEKMLCASIKYILYPNHVLPFYYWLIAEIMNAVPWF
ncbi:hypothetical protein ACE38U_07385 [Cedecea sp. S5-13]|uniref:hypothetical protein n=1 Tax=Cedecea selenatireducens TaxID=3144416 RepID=UPI0035CCE29A